MYGRAQSKDTYINEWTERGEWNAYEQMYTRMSGIEVCIVRAVSGK